VLEEIVLNERSSSKASFSNYTEIRGNLLHSILVYKLRAPERCL
jgi:hypothetical protein